MRLALFATSIVALTLASPAFAQRSLFEQPVGAPPAMAPPAAAPAPAVPAPAAAPTPRAAAAAPQAAAPAEAEEPRAKPRPKVAPKPRGPVPARSVTVFNGTPQALVGLDVSQDGKSARLKKPLAAGKKTTLALPAFKACEVGVAATFEGQAAGDPMPVDICKEKSLNFRD